MGGVEEPTTLAPYFWLLAASETGKEAMEGRSWWWWFPR
jgi:hypothetical protein